MTIGLCLGAYFLLVLLVLSYCGNSSGYNALLESLIIAFIIWSSGILVCTELLSMFHGVAFRPLVITYTCVNGVLALWIYQRRHLINLNTFENFQLDKLSWLLIAFMIFLIIIAALMAFICPPNNPDSLSYHLSRQIYWMQQRSLDHFLTPNDRQIMMPPLAEIIGLHFRILSNGDFWANLPQFLSYILCAITASLIARELGANKRNQIFASFLVLTIPMAFHQASNTKNDLLLGLLLMALAWQLLRYINSSILTWVNWILIGLNLALLWMVKGTGLLYSVPVMLSFGAVFLHRHGRLSWKPIIVISTISLLLSFGHYSRNYHWYGSIFGDVKRPGYDLTIKTPTLKTLSSNIIRNLSLHFGSPYSYLNAGHHRIIKKLHDWLQIDINEPATTYWASKIQFSVGYAPQIETKAPAPIHLIAAILVPFLILAFKSRKPSLMLFYWSLPFFSFVLFCLFVKWQPWHSRLQLPLFCLVSPAIAVCLAEAKKRHIFSAAFAFLLLLTMLPALNSYSRPVFKPRNIFNSHTFHLQYRNWPGLEQPQLEIYELIKNLRPSCIQFDLEWEWQYPIQQMILSNTTPPPHFWGQISPYQSPPPDMVIARAAGSEKSLFDQKSAAKSMIKMERYHPFIVFVDKSLISSKNKPER